MYLSLYLFVEYIRIACWGSFTYFWEKKKNFEKKSAFGISFTRVDELWDRQLISFDLILFVRLSSVVTCNSVERFVMLISLLHIPTAGFLLSELLVLHMYNSSSEVWINLLKLMQYVMAYQK